ncbi:hypothetical protein J7435_04860, partial [Xanthomonas phaseoli pv. dieffenbachiae]|uniref:hypothetical protein n=1 Tax=Xanthomonas phaseoli TaxID=1985254 RepID=UPI001ADB7D24
NSNNSNNNGNNGNSNGNSNGNTDNNSGKTATAACTQYQSLAASHLTSDPVASRSTFNARPALAAKNCTADTRTSRAVAPVLNGSPAAIGQNGAAAIDTPITRS